MDKKPKTIQDLFMNRPQVNPILDLGQTSNVDLGNFAPLNALESWGSEVGGGDETKKKRFAEALSQYGTDPTNALLLAQGGLDVRPYSQQMSQLPTPVDASLSPMAEQMPIEREPARQETERAPSKKEEISRIKNLLSKLAPSKESEIASKMPEAQVIPEVIQKSVKPKDIEMQKLLEQYKESVSQAELGHAINKGLAQAFGQVGAKVDEEGYKQALAQAGMPIELFQKQREADTALQQKQKAEEYGDPSSQRSKVTRDMVKQYLGIAGLNTMASKITDDMSAEQVDALTKGVFKDAVDQQMDMRRLQESILARKDIATARAEEKAEGAKEKAKLSEEKKNAVLKDVSQRQQDINDNLNDLEKMIDEYGTFEVFGSHNQDLDRKVDQIATDMAKLMDPNSVARPNEVELVKQGLVRSGFQNMNATAQEIIKNFKNEVNRRAQTAYEIRGLEAPALLSRDKTSLPKERIVGGKKFILQSDGSYEEAD